MRKPFSFSAASSLGLLFLLSTLSYLAMATPAEEAELEQLNQIERELEVQRDWAKYRWEKTNSECYQKYWVNR
ncbi:MAG: hypothetical protein B7Y05_17765, partial [Polynucleobacter sp. 24-46-87]